MGPKTVFSLFGGAIEMTEQSGQFTLSFNETVGGGEAAGIVKGSGSIMLNGTQGLMLGEKLVTGLLPAQIQPIAAPIFGVVNAAIAAVE